MARVFRPVLRFPGRFWRMIRRRPWVTLSTTLLVAAGIVFGLWRYAVHQWNAAQVAVRQERPEEARSRLEFCLRVWPRSAEVHLLAARSARLTMDLDAAEAHLNRVLQLQGGASEEVQVEFLLLRVQAGEVDEVAPVLLDTVEKGNPQAPIILETLARACMHRLRYKLAWACLTRWIEFRPDEIKPYHWRAWVLERLGNSKGAMADYRHVLELDPEMMSARLRVAEMLLEDKQVLEALPHLERLYKRSPDDPQVRARLGQCRLLQGRTKEARELMESAVPQMPQDPALFVALANLELQEGRGAEAERRLRAVLEAEPSDTETLFVLASALQLQGKTEESAAVLRDYERTKKSVERINDLLTNVLDTRAAKADDYAEVGRLLLEIGRDKQGAYWLDRALQMEPGNQQAHRALAVYYDRRGDAANAAIHRRQVREAGPMTAGSGGPQALHADRPPTSPQGDR